MRTHLSTRLICIAVLAGFMAAATPIEPVFCLQRNLLSARTADANMNCIIKILQNGAEIVVTYKHDRPGLYNSILQAIDEVGGYTINISSLMERKNASGAKSVSFIIEQNNPVQLAEIWRRINELRDYPASHAHIIRKKAVLELTLVDRPSVLSRVTKILFKNNINISFFILPRRDNVSTKITFEIDVPEGVKFNNLAGKLTGAVEGTHVLLVEGTILEKLVNDLTVQTKRFISDKQRENITVALSVVLANNISLARKDKVTPLFMHPVEVVKILATEIGCYDIEIFCAAMLHDAIEDGDITEKELRYLFRDFPDVVDMVILLTNFEKNDALYLRRLVSSRGYSPYVYKGAQLIKIADRIHNLRTLGFGDAVFDQKIFFSTLDTFMPEFIDKLNAQDDAVLSKAIGIFKEEVVQIGAAIGLVDGDVSIYNIGLNEYLRRAGSNMEPIEYQEAFLNLCIGCETQI